MFFNLRPLPSLGSNRDLMAYRNLKIEGKSEIIVIDLSVGNWKLEIGG